LRVGRAFVGAWRGFDMTEADGKGAEVAPPAWPEAALNLSHLACLSRPTWRKLGEVGTLSLRPQGREVIK